MSHRDFANIAVGDTVIINSSRGRTLHTVDKAQGNPIDNRFKSINKKIEAFIKDFENHFI